MKEVKNEHTLPSNPLLWPTRVELTFRTSSYLDEARLEVGSLKLAWER